MRISHIKQDSYVDGPSGPRAVLFVQGCKRSCPGCQSQHLWSHDGGKNVSAWKLALQLLETGQPITISGGEPFEQPGPLSILLERIKQLDPHGHVIVYTGYTWETLIASHHPSVVRSFANIDILVDGPYIAGQDHDRLQWRGSVNQRAIDVRATLAKMAAVKIDPVVVDWDTPTLILTEAGDLLGAAALIDELTQDGASTRRCGQTDTEAR